jgi:hypothetical protein
MDKEKIALDFINVYRKYKEKSFRRRKDGKGEQSSKANKRRRNHLEEHTS